MTLPKNITDAIESLASAAHHAGFAEGGGGAPDDRVDAARAALEAAIAAAIQPVEPPTDAEVEAWERLRERVQKRMECTDHLGRLVWDEPTRRACKDVLDWIDEETYQHRRYPWHDEERGAGR